MIQQVTVRRDQYEDAETLAIPQRAGYACVAVDLRHPGTLTYTLTPQGGSNAPA